MCSHGAFLCLEPLSQKVSDSILPIFLLCLANKDGAVTVQAKITKEKDNNSETSLMLRGAKTLRHSSV